MNRMNRFWLVSSAAWLSACGGGGPAGTTVADPATTTNPPAEEPSADSGPGSDEPPVDEAFAPVADLRIAGASVIGGRSRQDLRSRLEAQDDRVRHCFETARRESGEPEGTVTVRLIVTPGGAVQRSEVLENETNSPSYADCLAAVARRVAFPASEGPVIVIFAFGLSGR